MSRLAGLVLALSACAGATAGDGVTAVDGSGWVSVACAYDEETHQWQANIGRGAVPPVQAWTTIGGTTRPPDWMHITVDGIMTLDGDMDPDEDTCTVYVWR